MVNLLESNDCDLAECNNDHPFFRTFLHDQIYDFSKKEDFLSFYQEIYAPLFPWNKMWRRKCLEGLKFNENIHFLNFLPNVNLANYAHFFVLLQTSKTWRNLYVGNLF
jgi:hypothetical protein